MGIPCDDAVVIKHGKSPNEPSVITVNCPDKAGLGCDICRVVLEFGLRITRADLSTDGKWCYLVLWVVSLSDSTKFDWDYLETRLNSACPPYLSFYSDLPSDKCSGSASLYLLKVLCIDQKGLLHDISKVLCELGLTIQNVKVMTTPDDRALDLIFITDDMELLHTKKRQDDTCEHLASVLGKYCISCELQLAGPEYESLQAFPSLPPAVADELFNSKFLEEDPCVQALRSSSTTEKKASITIDNTLSPVNTLLHIQCIDQKCLIYDIMRTSKDCNIWIAYGRVAASVKGFQNMDLFIQQIDGKKILNLEKQHALCSRMKEEMLYPLRVMVVNRGPDIELLVANPVELSGKGRPRVFYDVTLALKKIGLCIFSAEVGRHSTSDRQWEVYRFLLAESREFPMASNEAKRKVVESVRRTLMGW